jgi:hypothetical protein
VWAVPTEDGFVIAIVHGSRSDWLKNVMASGAAAIVPIQACKLEGFNCAVGILLQHQQVKHTDQITLDQVAQRGCNLPVGLAARKLDRDPVDRPAVPERRGSSRLSQTATGSDGG